jgi:glycosyltransferase involved in cell wall biosynthesis
VVCDNGSTDATPQVVEGLTATMPVPLRYVHEPRPGLSAARNRGIQAAAGRVIAFTDDDCVVPEGWVEAVHAEFRADPDLAMLAGRVEPLTPADGLGGTKHFGRRMTVSLAGFSPGRIAGCNMAIRRATIDRVGWFDLDLGAGALGGTEDADFLYRVLHHRLKALLAPEVVVFHGHGRSPEQLARTERGYHRGNGGFYVKHFLAGDRSVARRAYWDLHALAAEAWAKLRHGRWPREEAGAASAMLAGGLGMLGRRARRHRPAPPGDR